MFKLLKIQVTGFRQLKDNFEVSFTNLTKVLSDDLTNEVIEIAKGLYSFRTMSFVGANSSGKSTILMLILKSLILLQTGRWEYLPRDFNKEKITLSMMFYMKERIYEYSVELGLPSDITQTHTSLYSSILNQQLYYLKYDKIKGKKQVENFNSNKINISSELFILEDTSSIISYTKTNVSFDYFGNNNVFSLDSGMVKNSFFEILKNTSDVILFPIINLLDESIEYIRPYSSDSVIFKRYNENEIIMQNIELISVLSAGTIRGIELFARAYYALKTGKIFIVDEIEVCFQKNVVNNILDLFNDEKININNAQLIFSTHYTEILDNINRRDSIFITNKENNYIVCDNLYKAHKVRTEISKSRLFDNNIFNTSLNYEKLMIVRRTLINELRSNND